MPVLDTYPPFLGSLVLDPSQDYQVIGIHVKKTKIANNDTGLHSGKALMI